jgi:hypothetical protein
MNEALADKLVIRPPASVEEFHQVATFVVERYREAGYLGAGMGLSCPKALLIACRGTLIVGSLGVESAEAAPLPMTVQSSLA